MSIPIAAAVWIPIAIIIALLLYIISLLRRLVQSFSHSGGTPATPEGRKAAREALDLIEEIRKRENPRPGEAECERLKQYLETMIEGNVSQLTVTAIKNAVELLCP